jgi:hypothetical protein
MPDVPLLTGPASRPIKVASIGIDAKGDPGRVIADSRQWNRADPGIL